MTCKHDWHFLPGTDRLRCIRCNVETGPSTPEQLAQEFKFHEPQPNSIKFFNTIGGIQNTEVLRMTKDGIWANPDVPADAAAQAVLQVIDGHIKEMVERVRSEEHQGAVQVSPLEFVTMTLEKEHLVGKPLIWAQWPTLEQMP